MTLSIHVLDSIDRLDPGEYQAFFLRSRAPLFYDRRFLLAAEKSPLLTLHKVFYLTAREEGKLVALAPAYLQDINTIDPLGVLASSVGITAAPGEPGLFSHIMHCFETRVPVTTENTQVYTVMLNALAAIAETENARYFGLLNVEDGPLLKAAQDLGLNVHFMVDKYSANLGAFRDFEHLVQELPAEGRREMVRQLRKFDASGAQVRILAPPFSDLLERLTDLCQQTTARLGTPSYWPAESLAQFCRHCGDLIRLCVIEDQDELIGGFICFEEAGTLHAWTAGMNYEKTDFSPYSIGFAEIYRHAFRQEARQIEGGRLNARIKTRLGLKPVRLYAITSQDLYQSREKPPMQPWQILSSQLDGEARPASHPAFEAWYQSIAWNGRDFHRKPAGIVRVKNETDVIKTLQFASEQHLKISVRGGGHSYAGSFLKSDTLLLDLSALNNVVIDARRRHAIVEPGVSGGQLSQALAAQGLVFPTGHGRQVTVSGFLLGGGLGINCSQWGGMSVFNVEALDIITADGQLRHVDATHNPELFWAARGSGPTAFFVAVRFYLRCQPQPGIIANSVYTLPANTLDALLSGIEQAQPPANLQIMIALNPGSPTLILNTLAYTDDLETAQQMRATLFQHLPQALTPLEEDQPASFETLYQMTDNMMVSKRYRTDNILTDRRQDIAPILERHLDQSPSTASTCLLVWRGKPDYPDAAFSVQGNFFISTYAQWNNAEEDAPNRRWLSGLYDELTDIATGSYINEFDLELRGNEVWRCFAPDHWKRLEQLRSQHDPQGRFVRVEDLAKEARNQS